VIEPSDDLPEIDPLLRDALAWVVRLRSGEATKADLATIRQWRGQSAEHEEAFRQAALLWRDLKGTADRIVDHRAHTSIFHSWRPDRWTPTRRAFIGGAVAASAGAYLVYNPPMQLWPSFSELAADYRTAKGERREVAVAEGFSVTLNTQTSVALLNPENGDPRIELIAGEAAIETKRADARPVIVEALGVRMIATRASFNSRCLDGRLSVTCVDGQLDVESERGLVALRKGQQVAFTQQTGLGLAVAVNAAEATAWQHNLLMIRDRPLAEVVDEVNRYRTGRIVITSPTLARHLVNGTFHLETLDNFPSQVRELFGAKVRSLPGGVVLLS
jgi:transmembrane sensor